MPADLRDAPFVQLAELHRARRTGRLVVARGRDGLVVDIRRGQIVSVESQSVPDAGAEDTDELLEGLLAADPGLVRAAARERLLEALSWTDAFCGFTEGAAEGGDPPLALPTEEVLREAVQLLNDPDLVRAALGDVDRSLGLAFDPRQPKNLSLTPTEGYLLSRVDGTLSARQVLQLVPLDPAERERSLFSLLLSGLVEYLPRPGGPSAPAAGETTARGSEGGHRTEPPPRAAEPSAPAAPTPEQLEAARREAEEAYESKVGNRNHFEVLELDRSADAAAVKAAYFRLARRFHPDAHLHHGLDDLRDKLKAVFVRLGEANEVLGNPRKRGEYEASLPRGPFHPPRAGQGPPPAPEPARGPATPAHGSSAPAAPPPPTEEETAQRGDEVLARAESLMAEEKYWDAIQALEGPLATLTGKRLQRGRLLLARAYAKNPKWLRRAEEMAQKVAKDDPANPDAYLVLGAVYRAGGLETRAAAMYRKALELRPDSKEAREALGESTTPPPSPTPLLKRLFRKS